MALPTVLEKLQYNNEKNILIQGLPSSLEKQFIKLPFSKSVTPLLKRRKIEFALVFSVTKAQLRGILSEVVPVLTPGIPIWVSYPKTSSKIVSDLRRDSDWECLSEFGFSCEAEVELDNVWAATRFVPCEMEEVNATIPAGVKINTKIAEPA